MHRDTRSVHPERSRRVLLVYALAPATTTIRGRGIAGEPLRAVTAVGIMAIVGEMRRAPSPGHAAAVRYDAVIRRLGAATPALLPVRFGTTVADADELATVLKTRRASLAAALRRVRRRVQMTIRVVGEPFESPAPEPPRRAGSRGRASGADYLRARAAAAAREREIPGFAPVRAAVRRWVRDERVERRDRVATVYHLVPAASAAAYSRAAQAAIEQTPLRAVVSGPFPVYAFTEA